MGSLTEQEYRLPHFSQSFVFKPLRSLPGPGPAPSFWVRWLEKRSGSMAVCSLVVRGLRRRPGLLFDPVTVGYPVGVDPDCKQLFVCPSSRVLGTSYRY
jgi:hypothetical protein